MEESVIFNKYLKKIQLSVLETKESFDSMEECGGDLSIVYQYKVPGNKYIINTMEDSSCGI